MKPIEVVPVPFYMVGMDMIGPLKTTSRCNWYIINIDYFTKYVEAYTIPGEKAETVSRCVEDLCSLHSVLSIIQRDKGSNFISRLFIECTTSSKSNKTCLNYYFTVATVIRRLPTIPSSIEKQNNFQD
eukprot:gene6421-7155_t